MSPTMTTTTWPHSGRLWSTLSGLTRRFHPHDVIPRLQPEFPIPAADGHETRQGEESVQAIGRDFLRIHLPHFHKVILNLLLDSRRDLVLRVPKSSQVLAELVQQSGIQILAHRFHHTIRFHVVRNLQRGGQEDGDRLGDRREGAETHAIKAMTNRTGT